MCILRVNFIKLFRNEDELYSLFGKIGLFIKYLLLVCIININLTADHLHTVTQ